MTPVGALSGEVCPEGLVAIKSTGAKLASSRCEDKEH